MLKVARKKVDLTKPDQTPSGETSPPRDESAKAIERLINKGELAKRTTPGKVDDLEVRESFTKLMLIGAPRGVIMNLLQLTPEDCKTLTRQHLESAIDTLSDHGVVGSVALSFQKLESVSARMTRMMMSLDENNAKDREAILAAARLVKDTEAEKINLLVKTGAVKVKKKVEIHGQFETGNSIDLYSGERAQRVMVDIMAAVAEQLEPDDDGVFGPVPKDDL